MLVWGRFLHPGSVDWLSGLHAMYWVLCVFASLASIALALQETMTAGRQMQLEQVREVRRAHREFSLSR